jgi:transcriptional regulator with XRE-family HTH domain
MGAVLKAARHARGWSGTQFAEQMHTAGRELGVELPTRASLRILMHRWESGRAVPNPLYRRLLCTLYQATAQELGLPGPAYEAADTDAVTALLYAAPVTTGQLALLTLPVATEYVRVALAHPTCPDPHQLAAGLRQARTECAPWLDRPRLLACECLALALAEHTEPGDELAARIPAWLTNSQSAAAGSAARVFSNTAG